MKHWQKFMLYAFVILSACATPKKDYESIARCQELGYKPGTSLYDQCLKEEKASRLLQEQRREFDQRKQDERDWKIRR